MVSTKQDIIIEQGATYHTDFALLNSNNEPLLVAGLEAQSQMRRDFESVAHFDFTCTLTNGNLSHDMPAALTRTIELGRYLYDIEISNDQDNVIRVIEGVVTVMGEISHD